MITESQINFLNDLLDSTQEDYREYSTKPIKELSKYEASGIIQKLIDIRDSEKNLEDY